MLVNLPELQHAILSSGLINWLGALDKHKAINFGLKHLNGNCKIEIKCYKNFTYDTDIMFDQVCLSNMAVRMLHSKMKYIFGEEMSGAHMQAKADLNIFTLA